MGVPRPSYASVNASDYAHLARTNGNINGGKSSNVVSEPSYAEPNHQEQSDEYQAFQDMSNHLNQMAQFGLPSSLIQTCTAEEFKGDLKAKPAVESEDVYIVPDDSTAARDMYAAPVQDGDALSVNFSTIPAIPESDIKVPEGRLYETIDGKRSIERAAFQPAGSIGLAGCDIGVPVFKLQASQRRSIPTQPVRRRSSGFEFTLNARPEASIVPDDPYSSFDAALRPGARPSLYAQLPGSPGADGVLRALRAYDASVASTLGAKPVRIETLEPEECNGERRRGSSDSVEYVPFDEDYQPSPQALYTTLPGGSDGPVLVVFDPLYTSQNVAMGGKLGKK